MPPLVADENAYHRTFQFRQLSRFVTEPTLARCDNYQAMCTGVDHRHPLPPFFPNIRSQDTLFAWMTLRQSPNAWFAFLPPILTHNREPRRQSMPNWAALEAATVPFQLIMLKLLDTHQPVRLAEFFAQLGTMPPNEFRHLMRTTRWDIQCDRLAAVDHALRTATPAPDFWRRDLLQFQTGVLAALQAEPQETPQASQREFQLFAQLLEAWPALVRSAAALRRNGNPLARSL